MPNIAHISQGGNFYKRSARAFYVEEYPDDAAYFASLIVHESTHGYLFSRGFRYEGSVRERHERTCTKEQFAFIIRAIRAQNHISQSQREELVQQWKDWLNEQLASNWWHG